MSHSPELKLNILLPAGNEIRFYFHPTCYPVVQRTVQSYLEQAVGLLPSTQSIITIDA